MRILRQLIAIFTLPTEGAAERQYIQARKVRQDLDDRAFYDSFCLSTEISMDTCSRVRKVLKTQLNMSNVRPDDNIAQIFDDIDIEEICFEIGEEFDIEIPCDMIDLMDGTVDSIMRATERLRNTPDNNGPEPNTETNCTA